MANLSAVLRPMRDKLGRFTGEFMDAAGKKVQRTGFHLRNTGDTIKRKDGSLWTKKEDGYYYREDGSRVPYSNGSRPNYASGQVEKVWENSRKRFARDLESGRVEPGPNGFKPEPPLKPDQLFVVDRNGNWREVTWKPGDGRQGQWDMGHASGQEYRDLYNDYMTGEIDEATFLQQYQSTTPYTVQDPGRNRSHVDEG